jgi:hypothetical protein
MKPAVLDRWTGWPEVFGPVTACSQADALSHAR